MKIVMFLLLVVLSPLAAVVAGADQSYDDVDREMIQLLNLDAGQVPAYLAIIRAQRQRFLALQPGEWQQELALYHETFAQLKAVLTAEQHVLFVGFINSAIEHVADDELLAMENYSTQGKSLNLQ